MKKILVIALASALAFGIADAKPGGGGGGGHASGGGGGRSSSSFSAPSPSKGSFSAPQAAPRPAPAPAQAAPTTQKGSFSAPQAPAQSAQAPRQTTTTTSTTTVSRNYSYSGRYVSPGGMYGGWGMGYGYSNGLLTGLIIGNLMHPHGTVMYAGPGMYANNAVLYPNGTVVNQQGYQVGTYQNGVFTPVNGGMVAQQVPADAGGTYNSTTQPAVIVKTGPTPGEIVAYVIGTIVIIFLIIVLIGMVV